MNEPELQKLFFQSSYFARLWKTLGLENVLINYYAIGNYGRTEKFISYSKKVFLKDIQGHNSRESKETSGGFVKTWQILPKTKCKSLLPSFTKSYQIVTFTASHNFSSRKCVLLVGVCIHTVNY